MGNDEYFDYKDNTKYDTSRIVSIVWYYSENYNPSDIKKSDIKSYIRKPKNFNEIINSNIHGITFEQAVNEGKHLSNIINNLGFGYALDNTEYIIAYNSLFHINILLNELHRIKFNNCIKKIETLLDTDKIKCIGKIGTQICKLLCKEPIKYKMPTISELYKHFYGYELNEQHTPNNQFMLIIKILQKM